MRASRKYDIDRTIRWYQSDHARKIRVVLTACAAYAATTTASADATTIDYAYSGPYALSCGEELLITASGSILDGITGYETCADSPPSITNSGTVGALNLSRSNTGDITNHGTMDDIWANGDPSGQFAQIQSIVNTGNLGSVSLTSANAGQVNNQLGGTSLGISIDNSSTLDSINNAGSINGDIYVGFACRLLVGITNTGDISGSITNVENGSIGQICIGGVSSPSSVGNISNAGTMGSIEGLGAGFGSATQIGTITNSGEMGTLCLSNNAVATGLDNSGTMFGIILDSSGALGFINNSGTMSGSIHVGADSKVNSITNNGDISGEIKNSGTVGDITVASTTSGASIDSITNTGTGIMGNITVGGSSGSGDVIGQINNSGYMGVISAEVSGSVGDINNTRSIDSIYAGGAESTAGGIGNITNAGTINCGIHCESSIDSVTNQSASTIYGGITVAAMTPSAACTIGDLTNHGTITGDITASLTDQRTSTGVFTNDGTWDIGAMTDAQSWLNDFVSTESAVLALALQSVDDSPETMITIIGDVTIDGDLNIRAATGLDPVVGDQWNFLSATGSLTGEYDNYAQGDTILKRGGLLITINYGTNGITFEAAESNAVVPGAAGLSMFGLGGIIRRRRRKH